jgi:hypothetical protein
MPQIAAAHALADLFGKPALHDAADAYVRDFLARCIAGNGLFLWGNHYYFDAFQGRLLRFAGQATPIPCDPAADPGDLHEVRPLPPAWGAFWRVSPNQTERAIRAMLERHVFDPATGAFNRHAHARPGCAFLEAGGILVDAAAWLFRKTGDPALLDRARRIADYSFRHRHPATGLLENNPTETRWDKHTATTEVGLWAGCLARASDLVPEWKDMACQAMRAWTEAGWDAVAGRYWGRLNVADAHPILGPKTTEYQPPEYSDFWDPLFPAHDYPFQMAEACIALERLTGEPFLETAVRRWIAALLASLPPRGGRGAYAEHYGRALHLLAEAAETFQEPRWRDQAEKLAQDALAQLWTGSLFRTHPGEDRYDAVDGAGCLLLGLIRLETGQDPDLMGFHF